MSAALRFDERVAVVTGAGRGMGREHAMLLARRGAAVIVNDVAAEPAEQTASDIRTAGGKARACVADIATWAGARSLIEATLQAFGGIHILVSNAAIINSCPMLEMTPERFETLFRINAFGPFYTVLAAWPHLMKQRYGRVVLVSSDAAVAGQPLIAHYAAAKGAVMGMVRSLALEGRDSNVLVNGLFPGAFTQMVKDAISPEAAAEMERLLPAHLVSPAVGWLVHEDSSITGEFWQAAGGRVGRLFVGSTPGYWNAQLQIEDVRDHVAQIRAEAGYSVSGDTGETLAWILRNSRTK